MTVGVGVGVTFGVGEILIFGVGVGLTRGRLICAEAENPKLNPKLRTAKAKNAAIFKCFLFIDSILLKTIET